MTLPSLTPAPWLTKPPEALTDTLSNTLRDDEVALGLMESGSRAKDDGYLWLLVTDRRALVVTTVGITLEAPTLQGDVEDTLLSRTFVAQSGDDTARLDRPLLRRGAFERLWEMACASPPERCLLGAEWHLEAESPDRALRYLEAGLAHTTTPGDAAALNAPLAALRWQADAAPEAAQAAEGLLEVYELGEACARLEDRGVPKADAEALVIAGALARDDFTALSRLLNRTGALPQAEPLRLFAVGQVALAEGLLGVALDAFDALLEPTTDEAQLKRLSTLSLLKPDAALPPFGLATLLCGERLVDADAKRDGARFFKACLSADPLFIEGYRLVLTSLGDTRPPWRQAVESCLWALDRASYTEHVGPEPPPTPKPQEPLTKDTRDTAMHARWGGTTSWSRLKESVAAMLSPTADKRAVVSEAIRQHCVRAERYPELHEAITRVNASLGYDSEPPPCFLSGHRVGGQVFTEPAFIVVGDLHVIPNAPRPLTQTEQDALLAGLILLAQEGIALYPQEVVDEGLRNLAFFVGKKALGYVPVVRVLVDIATVAEKGLKATSGLFSSVLARLRPDSDAPTPEELGVKLALSSFFALCSGDRAARLVCGDLRPVLGMIVQTSDLLTEHANLIHRDGLTAALTLLDDEATEASVVQRLRELLTFELTQIQHSSNG